VYTLSVEKSSDDTSTHKSKRRKYRIAGEVIHEPGHPKIRPGIPKKNRRGGRKRQRLTKEGEVTFKCLMLCLKFAQLCYLFLRSLTHTHTHTHTHIHTHTHTKREHVKEISGESIIGGSLDLNEPPVSGSDEGTNLHSSSNKRVVKSQR
jgi:hypothetical protein